MRYFLFQKNKYDYIKVITLEIETANERDCTFPGEIEPTNERSFSGGLKPQMSVTVHFQARNRK